MFTSNQFHIEKSLVFIIVPNQYAIVNKEQGETYFSHKNHFESRRIHRALPEMLMRIMASVVPVNYNILQNRWEADASNPIALSVEFCRFLR